MSGLNNLNKTVTLFLDELNHPLKKDIELLREIILSSDKNLSENIKWNGPNYSFHDIDCITMRVQPITLKNIQIILHRGAKKVTMPANKLIETNFDKLSWKENDRAIITFKNLAEIETNKIALQNILIAWLQAIDLKK